MDITKTIGLILIMFFIGCAASDSGEPASVRVGAEVLLQDHLDELKGQRVGLVMNPTARVNETHMLDTLLARGVNVTALFAPEHGFRGEAGAGEVIEDGVDQATGLPVYSLYGDTKKPTEEMLVNVDVLLFDMQDVGARFYTYHVTLGLLLESAASSGVPVWVLDRPNPAGGEYMAGWVLEKEYKSFVGAYPIPMAHGMTLGELAKMMVGEGWIDYRNEPDLRVIPMRGWQRSMKWPDTGLPWVPPSPNLPTFEHSYAYLGTVLFEGTNLSEGRGTDDPFLLIGSPNTDIDLAQLDQLKQKHPGVAIEQVTFTPRSLPGKAPHPKLEGETCHGVKLSIKNYNSLDPVAFGVALLDLLLKNTEAGKTTDFIYNLTGSKSIDSMSNDWQDQVKAFEEERQKYLIYQ